jgi:hypothetical protein
MLAMRKSASIQVEIGKEVGEIESKIQPRQRSLTYAILLSGRRMKEEVNALTKRLRKTKRKGKGSQRHPQK